MHGPAAVLEEIHTQCPYPDANPAEVYVQGDDGVALALRTGVRHPGHLIIVALLVQPHHSRVRHDTVHAGNLQAHTTHQICLRYSSNLQVA